MPIVSVDACPVMQGYANIGKQKERCQWVALVWLATVAVMDKAKELPKAELLALWKHYHHDVTIEVSH